MKNEDRELSIEELGGVTGGVAVDSTSGLAGAAHDPIREALTAKKAGLSLDNKPVGAGMQESSLKN